MQDQGLATRYMLAHYIYTCGPLRTLLSHYTTLRSDSVVEGYDTLVSQSRAVTSAACRRCLPAYHQLGYRKKHPVGLKKPVGYPPVTLHAVPERCAVVCT
jgi:hypothetical protein